VTESFIVVATSFASLFLIDPLFKGALTKFALAKALTLILGYGSLGLHLLGRAVVAPERFLAALSEVLRDWWPAIVLALFILAGSVFARTAGGVQESFLAFGLGLLFLPMTALAARAAEKPFLLMKWLIVVYVLTVVTMLGLLFAEDHVFHEAIFVAVPAGAYLIFARSFSWWRCLLGLALIASCLFSFKNTTFLLVLTTLVGCLAVWLPRTLRGSNPIAVALGVLAIVPAGLAACAALVWAWWENRELLPSGNVEYRTEMYGIAWRQFLESPIWGTAFTDSSVNYFRLFKIDLGTQWLPTHSDILDLMAHGGVIALVLWLLLVWKLVRMSLDTLRALVRREEGVDLRPWQWMGVLALIQFGAMITYAINPILISPVHAYWVWGTLGLMWALHRELTAAPLPRRMTYAALLQQTVMR
jgi:O-antigen ligase